jgi:hypothetical protein
MAGSRRVDRPRPASRPYLARCGGIASVCREGIQRDQELEHGLLHRLDEVMQTYVEARDSWHCWVVPLLRDMTLRELMEGTGLNRRTIQGLRHRHAEPRPGPEKTLIRAAGSWARRQLLAQRVTALRSDVLACRAWLEAQPLALASSQTMTRLRPGCTNRRSRRCHQGRCRSIWIPLAR